MSENRDSCNMQPIDRDWSIWQEGEGPKIGEFQIVPDGELHRLYMVLPSDTICIIPIRRGNETKGAWAWDGNEQAPTLSPSVWQKGCWHGWIRAGRMESC